MIVLTVFLSDVVFLSDCESESDDASGFWIRRLGLYQCDLLSLNPNMDLTENIMMLMVVRIHLWLSMESSSKFLLTSCLYKSYIQ